MGTAWCGPACQVVWGLGERFPRLPDYVLAFMREFIEKSWNLQVIIYPNSIKAEITAILLF